MTEEAHILESQLRECYGRAVYTHKTHEVCADVLLSKLRWIKRTQIVLSALVTGGILSTLASWSESGKVLVTLISATLSTALLAVNAFAKDRDLGETAQKHRQAAADIWLVREGYFTLLTDLRSGALTLDFVRRERDRLLEVLHTTYKGAPSTNAKAYAVAQKRLKEMEDLTFTDAEIDVFLPQALKRTVTSSTSASRSAAPSTSTGA